MLLDLKRSEVKIILAYIGETLGGSHINIIARKLNMALNDYALYRKTHLKESRGSTKQMENRAHEDVSYRNTRRRS